MATEAEIPKQREQSVRIKEPERTSQRTSLDMSIYNNADTLPKTPTRGKHEKDKKIGHRRVDQTGQVTYKKKPTSELMAAIQLGVGQSVGALASKPERDLLLQDFATVESVVYPREGSNLTPAHHFSDFRFKTYAAIAFRYFRELFKIKPDDFLLSLCNDPLQELSNPGASGSIFYLTNDDEFIIKTVQHKEADFLQKLLPGYYMNLNQNPRTLLPKFYGLYCYQCGGKNIRFVVMNNLLPSSIKMHEKYDLKGSTYKRKASKRERDKKSPTLKDLDFIENHPDGIMLEAETYSALVNTISRDCRVLQSFKIMDYSLLLGIYNLDLAAKQMVEGRGLDGGAGTSTEDLSTTDPQRAPAIARTKSTKARVAQYSTAMEAIHAPLEPLDLDDQDIPPGGIPARNSKGERLMLYIGVIDILQSYRLKKKLEHAMKAMVHDGDTVSVHRPGFYAQRFNTFFEKTVFKKIPSLDQPQVKGPHMRFKKLVQLALKHSPSKKKTTSRQRSMTTGELETKVMEKPMFEKKGENTEPAGAVGGRPDLLPENATPPSSSMDVHSPDHRSSSSYTYSHPRYSSHTDSPLRKPEVITTSPSFQQDTESQQQQPSSGATTTTITTSTDSGPSTAQSSRRELYSSQMSQASTEQVVIQIAETSSNTQSHTVEMTRMTTTNETNTADKSSTEQSHSTVENSTVQQQSTAGADEETKVEEVVGIPQQIMARKHFD